MKAAIITFVLLVVFAIAASAISSSLSKSRNTPQAYAKRFVNYLIADNASSSYAMFTSSYQKQTSESEWASEVKASFANMGAKAAYDKVAAQQDPAHVYGKNTDPQRVSFTLTLNDHTTWATYVIMVKATKNGVSAWQVADLTSYKQ